MSRAREIADRDLAGTELILDADNDTSITADTDDTINFKVGGSDRLTINSSGDIDVETGDIFFSGSSKGINLGVTSNTDGNTLDDYEEGTWTPTMSGVTLSTAEGTYVKVGQLVTAHFNVIVPSISSGTGAAIGSMPFASGGQNFYGGGFFHYHDTSFDNLGGYIASGNASIAITNPHTSITLSNASGKQFIGTIVYKAAS
tara:strand:- start:74 stop:676 length:603 start_codon:yes stop_codon:yes gene_type:complete